MHGTSPQLIEIELRNGGVVIPVNAYESSRRRKSEVRSLGGKSERHGFQCAYPSRARRDPLGRIFRGGLGVGSRKPRGRALRQPSRRLRKVIGAALALELIQTFLHAHFIGAARNQCRLAKVQALEIGNIQP
jgi:hypothetical protein